MLKMVAAFFRFTSAALLRPVGRFRMVLSVSLFLASWLDAVRFMLIGCFWLAFVSLPPLPCPMEPELVSSEVPLLCPDCWFEKCCSY